jgi:zinc transport system substrate-binding protein
MILMCFYRRSWAWLLVALLVAPALISCGSAAGDQQTQVVAGLYPYAFLAQRIGGPHVDVVDLTSPGVEPHDLELTPQQIASVVDGDVLVYQSGFQPAVDAAVAEAPTEQVLDVRRLPAVRDITVRDDPHVWLDPTAMTAVAEALGDGLAAADPAHAQRYRANAALVQRQLAALDRDYRRGLEQCAQTSFVTSHAAFGYLARRYGLRMVAIAGLDPGAEPSPGRQARLVDRIRSSGVTTIFTERLASSAIAESLATDTGTTVATLDPIETSPAATGNKASYLSAMRANLAVLRQANGCR